MKQKRLNDGGNYGIAGIGLPLSNNTLKPRIVESISDTSYYISASRSVTTGPHNEIVFWVVNYSLGATGAKVYEYYNTNTGYPDIFATGEIEDEGTYSGGSPAVYISGYMTPGSAGTLTYNPLLIQVTSLTANPPTFTPLQIIPGSSLSGSQYLVAPDLTINKQSIGGSYNLMVPCNYYDGTSIYDMEVYNVPLPIPSSSPPTITGNYIFTVGTFPMHGQLSGITNTIDHHMYMIVGEDRHNDLILCRTDESFTLCNPTFTTTTAIPPTSTPICTSIIDECASGGLIAESPQLFTATPDVHSITKLDTSLCYVTPPPPPPTPHQSTKLNQGITTVYPDPIIDIININISAQITTSANIQVFDMLGREMLSKKANVIPGLNHIEINMHNLAHGNYIIQITNDDKSINNSVKVEKF